VKRSGHRVIRDRIQEEGFTGARTTRHVKRAGEFRQVAVVPA
jgi:hypothetical protein